jgi:5-methylcytosine-specific restriction protein A
MTRALAVCSTPGCPKLVKRGKCDDCERERRKRSNQRSLSPAASGYDRKWARTRGRYLQLHPWCAEDGCDEPATEVDHIDGLGPNGPNGHKHHNLRGYCRPHHSKRTARDQPGGWYALQRGGSR